MIFLKEASKSMHYALNLQTDWKKKKKKKKET